MLTTLHGPTPLRNLLLELIAAAVLGGAIGAQRQATHKPAGFRTHLLVALGSCAFMELSRIAGDTRIAAGVITGIGFLGAGSIVREGLQPRGLTTAASIWAASAIGLAMGFGNPVTNALGALTTVLVLLALSFTDQRFEALFPSRIAVDVTVTFDLDALSLEELGTLFAPAHVHVRHSDELAVEREGAARIATWKLELHAAKRHRLREAIVVVSSHAAIRRVASQQSGTR